MKYEFNKEQIKIGTKYQLEGLLTIPITSSNDACPAVVLVHGSGANDMNEKVGNVQPFKDLAEGLAKQGIATIRYNKRTLTFGALPEIVWENRKHDRLFA